MFVFMLVLLYRVCTYVILGILVNEPFYLCVWFFLVNGMYLFNTGYFGKRYLVLCLCYYKGYVDMRDW